MNEVPEADSWKWTCTRVYFGENKVTQPAYQAGPDDQDELFIVCEACSQTCFVPEQITPAVGICGEGFVCRAEDACDFGLGMYLYGERLKEETSEVLKAGQPAHTLMTGSLQQAALAMQTQFQDPTAMQQMCAKLNSGFKTVSVYEDPAMQAAALREIPVETLRKRAEERGLTEDHALLRELLKWFKGTFSWVNKPPCQHCGQGRGSKMIPRGMGVPTAEERSWWAGRVEVYQCQLCNCQSRFPRINHPGKLMETKKGRCGEWANAFTLCCRAMGFEARYVLDWTDHVWTEVWSDTWNRWLHADACENALDRPLMYEQGWGKKITYIVAFEKYGIKDVTRRYSRKYFKVLARRGNGGIPEIWLKNEITRMDGVILSNATGNNPTQTAMRMGRKIEEEQELLRYATESFDINMLSEEEKRGRISGDAEWKAQRGEDGASIKPRPRGPKPQAPWIPVSLSFLLGHADEGPAVMNVEVLSTVRGDKRMPQPLGAPGNPRPNICIEGVICGQGGMGHNIVVVDPNVGVITHSKNFNCQRDVSAPKKMISFIEEIPNGHIVIVAIQICSAKEMTKEACEALKSLGAPEDEDQHILPGKGNWSWLLVSCKGPSRPPWFTFKSIGDQQGPSRALLQIPIYIKTLNLEWSSESHHQVCNMPSYSVPLDGEAPELNTEELRDLVVKNHLLGYSVKEGEAPLVFGYKGMPLKFGDGWQTYRLGPELEQMKTPAADPQEVLQSEIKRIFAELVAEGQSPADAAANALARATTAQSQQPSITNAESTMTWNRLDYLNHAGACHDDTKHFDDARIHMPRSPLAEMFPRIAEIKVWSGDFVNGIQIIYEYNGGRVAGGKYLGTDGSFTESCFIFEEEEVIVEVSVQSGGVMDQFSIRTSAGREQTWGGQGGGRSTWQIPEEGRLFGFYGGFGGHIHYLAPVVLYSGGDVCTRDQRLNSFFYVQESIGLCSEVQEAVNNIFERNTHEDAVLALKTVCKYAQNILSHPEEPKYRRIRQSNNFFFKNLGRFVGSGLLLEALGFESSVGDDGKLYLVLKQNNYSEMLFHHVCDVTKERRLL